MDTSYRFNPKRNDNNFLSMKCLKLCQNICPIFSILFSFGKWGEATYRKTLHAQRLLLFYQWIQMEHMEIMAV